MSAEAADSHGVASATSHLHDFGTGKTEPQLFRCSDGVDRVLKLQGLAAGPSLASDWVGALLAVEPQVLTPAPKLVEVSEASIATLPIAQRMRAHLGMAFGTTYVRTAATVHGLPDLRPHHSNFELVRRPLRGEQIARVALRQLVDPPHISVNRSWVPVVMVMLLSQRARATATTVGGRSPSGASPGAGPL